MKDADIKNNAISQDDSLEILIFLAQERATEIRENKNHQRDITYQFIFIVAAVLGIFEILKNDIKSEIPYYIFKGVIIACGFFTLYFLCMLQKSLADYRKKLSKIWDEYPFAFAFDKKILEYPKGKRKYCSFCNNFLEYTFIYMIMVISVVTIIICLLK